MVTININIGIIIIIIISSSSSSSSSITHAGVGRAFSRVYLFVCLTFKNWTRVISRPETLVLRSLDCYFYYYYRATLW